MSFLLVNSTISNPTHSWLKEDKELCRAEITKREKTLLFKFEDAQGKCFWFSVPKRKKFLDTFKEFFKFVTTNPECAFCRTHETKNVIVQFLNDCNDEHHLKLSFGKGSGEQAVFEWEISASLEDFEQILDHCKKALKN